jgi:hypothetical protein
VSDQILTTEQVEAEVQRVIRYGGTVGAHAAAVRLRDAFEALRAKLAQAERERDELLDGLADCIGQACGSDGDELDSMALSAYRDGLILLAKHRRVVIEERHGRRVIAKWSADAAPKE